MRAITKNSSNIFTKTLRKGLYAGTAIVTAGALAFGAGAANAKDVGQHDVWEFGSFKEGAEGTITGQEQGYVQYSGDRIIGDLVQEDIGALGHVDLNARLTVARGVESGAMHILGKLTSSGEVFVLDVNGFVFGANSIVDTAGFAAIGGNISDEDILDGDGVFDIDVSEKAAIEIREGAKITVAEAGLAAFVAPTISNSGVIKARLGKVAFASGEKVTLDLYGDQLVEIEVPSDQVDAVLKNSGTIDAEGGEIYMTADAAKHAVDNIINVEGVMTVASATQKGGKIILSGGGAGTVKVAGKVDASGKDGGEIRVTGENITTTSEAWLTADGDDHGGDIRFIAQNKGIFNNRFSALGGVKGGFVDTSAFNDIQFLEGINVDVGRGGTWLIDPVDITIDAVLAGALESTMDGGGLGYVTTDVPGSDDGNITVASNIEWTGEGSLLLEANNNIYLNARIKSDYVGGTGSDGAVTFKADGEILAGSFSNVPQNDHRTIETKSGDIRLTSKDDIKLGGGNTKNVRLQSVDGNIVLRSHDDIRLAGTDSHTGNWVRVRTENGNIRLIANRGKPGNDGDIQLWAGDKDNSFVEVVATNGTVTMEGTNLDMEGGTGANTQARVQGGTEVEGFFDKDVALGANSIIESFGGDIDIEQDGTFSSVDANTIITSGTGTISLDQNDGGSIQNAIDAIDNAGTGTNTITVGDGTYNENVTISEDNFTLLSENGRDNTMIEGISGVGALGTVQLKPNTTGVQIGDTDQGFTIVGIDNGAPGIENAALYLQGNQSGHLIKGNDIVANGDSGLTSEYGATVSDITIDGNIFSGQTFVGPNPAGDGFGQQFTLANVPRQLVVMGGGTGGGNTSNITFTNNEITGTAGGLNGSGNPQGNTLVTIDADDSEITDNTFMGTTTRYGASLRARGDGTLISGNTFHAAGLTDTNVHVSVTPNVYTGIGGQDDIIDIWNSNTFVGKATVTDSDLIPTTDWIGLTIQGAVDGSTNGATVYVNGGATYNESVLVDKTGLTLLGANAGIAGYDGGSRGPESIVTGGSPAFTIAADNVTVDGFLMDGAGLTYGVLLDDVKGTEIKNNIVKNAQNAAVGGVVDHHPATVTTTIADNFFEGTNSNGVILAGDSAGKDANENLLGTQIDILNNVFGTNADAIDGVGIGFGNIGDADGSIAGAGTTNISTTINIDTNTVYTYSNGIEFDGDVDEASINITGNTIDAGAKGVTFAGKVIDSGVIFDGGAITANNDAIRFGKGLHSGADVDVTNVTVTATSGQNEAIDVQGTLRNGATFDIDGGSFVGHGSGVEFSNIAGDATITGASIEGQHANAGQGINILGNISGSLDVSDSTVIGAVAGIGRDGNPNKTISGSLTVTDSTIEGTNGDGIELGNVTGSVTIHDNVKITGGDNGIQITGDLDDAAIAITKNDHIRSGENGILIAGEATGATTIEIDKSRVRLATNGAGISVSDTTAGGLDLDITRNSVWKTGTDGIYVENAPDVLIENNNIGYYGGGLTPVWGTDVIGDEGIDVNNSAGAQITNNNVINTASNGISVNPSPGAHVAGNTIIDAGGNGIDVQDSAKVRVYDNTVDGALKGIYGDNVSDIHIRDNDISNTKVAGIHVENSHGSSYKTTDIDIWSNMVASTSGTGILIQNSNYASVGDHPTNPFQTGYGGANIVSGGDAGIVIENSDKSWVSHNIVKDVNGDAISVTDSDDAKVLKNVIGFTDETTVASAGVNNIVGDGIFADNANGIEISENIITETHSNKNAKGSGIQVLDSDDTLIDLNVISNTRWDGVRVVDGDNVTITGNEAANSRRAGMYADNISNSKISENTVDTTQQFRGIALWNSDIVEVSYNTVLNTKRDGIIAGNVSGLEIFGNVIYDTGHDGIEVSNSVGALIEDNYIGYPDTIGTSAGANNIGAEGIDVNNSSGAQILGNQITETVSNGISLNPSDDVLIDGNVIINAGADGINVDGGDNNTVSNNTIISSGSDGIDGGNGVKNFDVLSNIITGAGNEGIVVNSGVNSDILIDENVITNPDNEGISIGDATDVTISNNMLEGNGPQKTGEGIEIDHGVSKVTITDNTVQNFDYELMDIDGSGASPTFDILISNNILTGGDGEGIEIGGNVSDVTITGNTISNNGDVGIDIDDLRDLISDLTISNNTISDNSDGIYLARSEIVSLLNNTISNNEGYGIHAGNGNADVVLAGNTLRDNGTAAARFESGEIDISNLTNPNEVIYTNPLGTPIGLQFDGSPLELTITGETLGGTEFTGFTNPDSFYVRFEDGSILDPITNAPIIINGLNATFDGFTPPARGVLTQSELDFLEARLFDADDALINGRGQIFSGFVPVPTVILNIEDFFNQFGPFSAGTTSASVTITGLPRIDGVTTAQTLANIEPFAGGQQANNPQALANIEPAAGDEETDAGALAGIEPAAGGNANCWGEAMNSVRAGQTTSFTFGGSFKDSVAAEANCGTESF